MSGRIVYVYLPGKLADWELGFILPELRRGSCFKKGMAPFIIKTFALTKDIVMTMGGLRIVPDLVVEEVAVDRAALMLLPGSDGWLEPGHEDVLQKGKKFLKQGIPVGAICGATLALGRAGVLDEYAHTSNDLAFLKSVCPEYKGEALYRNESAVTDRNLITAGGTAPLEFARNIFTKLDVMNDEVLDVWYKLYKTQNPQYYFKLMQLLS